MGVSTIPQQGFLPGMVQAYAGGVSPVPTGWLLCDGAAVSRAQYPALFAAISTTYGAGDGSTTFNLPNLKGKAIVMQDAAQAEFDVLGETGGEKTHVLTTAELSSHSHSHNHTQNAHSHNHSHGALGSAGVTFSLGTHGHTVNGHAHGGGTGFHAHTCLNNVYVTGTPAHGHSGAGDQSSERPNVTTGFSSPGNATNSVGQGNTTESPGTDAPNLSHNHDMNHTHGTDTTTATPTNNSDATTAGSGTAHNNLQPYLILNYLIKI